MQLSAGDIRPSAGRRVVAALLLVAACSQSEPFTYTAPREDGPLDPAPPVRLTYSVFEDQTPSWLPDGRGLVYSFRQTTSRSSDRCLGVLPPAGGQARQSVCSRSDVQDDSTDVYTEPAARTDGRIAWVEQHNLRGRITPDYGAIILGDLKDAAARKTLVRLPYLASSGSLHATVTSLRWLSPTQLAYVGADVLIRAPCQQCKPDTVVIAREVMLLSAAGGAPTLLPNSAETTSIWPSADSSALYYTVAGDTRVFQRPLSGGLPQVVHDFGGSGIARDVSVVGNRLVAIVGGNVSYGSEPLLGARQIDSGGVAMTVELGAGAVASYPIDTLTQRRPALSPDGRSMVLEGIARPSPNPNLWLVNLP